MLKERSLFFAKASVMEDIEEGRMPEESRLAIEFIAKDFPDPVGDEVLKQDQYQREIQEYLRERVFISCWRMDDCELSRAWREYVSNGRGIVIQSTYNKFKECFLKKGYRVFTGLRQWEESALLNSIFIEQVEYGSWQSSSFLIWRQCLLHFTRKRSCFEWENELRAFKCNPNSEIDGKGIPIPVDLEVLIEKIIVSPKMPELHSEVKSITAKHGLKIDVRKSSLR